MSGNLIVCFAWLAYLLGSGLYFVYHKCHPASSWRELQGVSSRKSHFCAPGIYSLLWRLGEERLVRFQKEKVENLQKLYPGETKRKLLWFHYSRFLGTLVFISWGTGLLIMAAIISEPAAGRLQQKYYLMREEPGDGETGVSILAEGGKERRQIDIQIGERKYSQKELQSYLENGEIYVKEKYLGENKSSEHVSQSLFLLEEIPGNPASVEWELDANGLVNEDGSLNNQNMHDETVVQIRARLSCQGEDREFPLELLIKPQKKTEETIFWEKWQEEMELLAEKTREQTLQELPRSVEGEKITYQEIKKKRWYTLLAAGLLGCILLPFILEAKEKKSLEQRRQQMLREYPEMIDRMLLLLGAGMTVKGIWYRITDEYLLRKQRSKIFNYLYEEMWTARREMEHGKTEQQAYEHFGRRISLLPYMKFATLLIQNIRKGSAELLVQMEAESRDTETERREAAKSLGEEAGTKLVFPMMVVLVLVFAMILIAAFWQL